MLQNFVPNNRPMTFSSACHGAQRPWPLLRIRLRLVVCSAGEYATVSYFHHRRRRHRHRMCVHVPAHLALIACYLLRSTPVFLTRKDTLLTPRAQPTVNLNQSLKFPTQFPRQTHTLIHTHYRTTTSTAHFAFSRKLSPGIISIFAQNILQATWAKVARSADYF